MCLICWCCFGLQFVGVASASKFAFGIFVCVCNYVSREIAGRKGRDWGEFGRGRALLCGGGGGCRARQGAKPGQRQRLTGPDGACPGAGPGETGGRERGGRRHSAMPLAISRGETGRGAWRDRGRDWAGQAMPRSSARHAQTARDKGRDRQVDRGRDRKGETVGREGARARYPDLSRETGAGRDRGRARQGKSETGEERDIARQAWTRQRGTTRAETGWRQIGRDRTRDSQPGLSRPLSRDIDSLM
jgi:hypothetical protein